MVRPDGAPSVRIRWDELEVEQKIKTPTNFVEWEEQHQAQLAKQRQAEAKFYETEPTPVFHKCDIQWCENMKERTSTYRGKKVYNRFCTRHEELWRKFRARKFTIEQFATITSKTQCDCCGMTFGNAKRNMDHDHSIHPGQKWCAECYRGVLCTRCNNFMAAIDDKEFLAQGQLYADETRK